MNKRLEIIIILLLVNCGVIGAGLTGYIAYIIYINGQIGPTIPKVGPMIQIQNISYNAGNLLIYVLNVGNGNVTIDTLCVNGKNQTFTNSSSLTLQIAQTVELCTALPSGFSSTNPVDVKIFCNNGYYTEVETTIP